MSGRFGKFGLMAIGAAFALSTGMAHAGDATEGQILQALKPKPLTRSLSGPSAAEQAKATETNNFVQTIRNRTTRSLSSGERSQIAEIAKEKPAIDLEITFDYNSANISQKALAAVDTLGRALTNPDLKGTTFVLAGHTDAVGNEGYNQDLSERRADTLKKYLVDKFGIAAADLVTVGYGKARLKNPNDPNGPENRRVQVVNMTESKVAGAN